MRSWISGLALSVALLAGGQLASSAAVAQDKKVSPQQQRMSSCSGEAKQKSLKGDARKSFMKECLSSGKPKQEATPRQARLKDCRGKARAQNLKGDARKSFMAGCLKG